VLVDNCSVGFLNAGNVGSFILLSAVAEYHISTYQLLEAHTLMHTADGHSRVVGVVIIVEGGNVELFLEEIEAVSGGHLLYELRGRGVERLHYHLPRGVALARPVSALAVFRVVYRPLFVLSVVIGIYLYRLVHYQRGVGYQVLIQRGRVGSYRLDTRTGRTSALRYSVEYKALFLLSSVADYRLHFAVVVHADKA